MRKIIGLLLIGLIAACNNVAVTDTEVHAVQSVLDFYGGVCNRYKGINTNDGDTETYFKLELSQSELIESYSNMLELPASNIAYLFYSNLKDEKDNYSLIKVKIVLPNAKSYEYSSSAADLKEMEELMQTFQTVTEEIKTQDFDGLIGQFEIGVDSNLTSESLKKLCIPYDSAYGHIQQTQFQGFKYFQSEKDNKELACLTGIMIREKGNNPVSLYIDRKTKKILSLEYEL